MRVTPLLRRLGQQHSFKRVVGDARGFEILDLRVHAVALANAVEPRAVVERFGGGAALPQIDAPGPTVLGVDELLADQPWYGPETGRDLAEMRSAIGEAYARR